MSIVIEPYDERWPSLFEAIRQRLWPAVADLALGIEHVGSTSVPGLWAKPIIDLDIITGSSDRLGEIVRRLAALGYEHLGQLGIKDRDAFKALEGSPRHNLYVCPVHSLALRNHLALREHLRSNPNSQDEYSKLKKDLAEKYPDDIDSYVEGKTAFIVGILKASSFNQDEIEAITSANKAPWNKPL